jgi:hypothetical protein
MSDNVKGTIRVVVNDREWTQVSSFRNAGPSDAVFVAVTENDITFLTFGDGVQGAALPTGTNNITATYHYGDGSSGSISKRIEDDSDLRNFWVIVRDDLQAAGWGDPATLRRWRRWWWWWW